ncbi:MAG: tRNA dihydrouridine synthase DusB [Pseudomonadota bacterium]
MSISIGKLTFPRPLFLGPMEGITDVPFRRIARKHGCGVVCTQMIHAEGFLRATSPRMREIATLDPEEQPVGMQLAGCDPNDLAEGAKKAEAHGAAFIDINMGCPAKNVVNLGSGAALLKDPPLAGSIVRAVRNAVSVPVTVKIRAGWDEAYKTCVEVASILEQEGADLITVHARTRAQRFKGQADWNLITAVKERVSIPVVGNGDVRTPAEIDKLRNETGCDGVMIARAALGNPWIFSGRNPTSEEMRDTVLEHLDLHLSFYLMHHGALMTFRKHLAWYTKGLKNSAEFRLRVFRERSVAKIVEMTEQFFDSLDRSNE